MADIKQIRDHRWLADPNLAAELSALAAPVYDDGGQVYNVMAFGAVGDGTTDDTAAIMAAINAAPSGGIVFFPGGKTFLCSQLSFDKRLVMVGAGKTSTTIKAKTGATGPLINMNGASLRPGFSLSGFTVDMTNAPTQAAIYLHNIRNGIVRNIGTNLGTIGLQMDLSQAMDIEDCDFLNYSTSGFVGSHASSSGNTLVNCFANTTTVSATALFDFQAGLDWWCFGCRAFRGPGTPTTANYGYRFAYAIPNTNATGALIRCSCDGISDGTSGSATVAGVFLQGVGNVAILGCHLSAFSATDATHNDAIKVDGCNSVRIQDSWISGRGIHFTGAASDGVKVSNCQFYAGDTGGAWFNFATNPTNLDEAGNTYGNGSLNIPRVSSVPAYLAAVSRNSQVANGMNLERLNTASFETVPPSRANSNNGALTSGTLYLFAIYLPQGWPVTNINWFTGSTALTNGVGPHYWAALYDSSFALLAQSTDNTAAVLAANTLITTALSSVFTTTYGGLHFVGIMVNSGTAGVQPTYSYAAGLSALLNTTTKRAWTAQTGLTTTAPNPAVSTGNISQLLYGFVN